MTTPVLGTRYATLEDADLLRQVEKLTKINDALMQRVERSMDQQANAFSLFQTAIGLEAQVRLRTEELKSALERLAQSNDELVLARDAAERANRFKTRFFTAVGHDLLQPLHAARLSLSAIAECGGDASHQRLTDQVDHALTSIEEILKTILDLSKLEAGSVRPAVQQVALSDLFEALIFDMEPIARSKRLKLSHRATNVLVHSDPLMLRRVLQNLLANAVRYTETGRILVAARRRGDDVRIEIWDTGPGILGTECDRIFEEFQRGSASENDVGGGFGLGLSIAQRMADSLGHRIDLCSRPNRGTCFRVYVPFAATYSCSFHVAKPVDARQVYGFAHARLLVIDNDASVLDAMRTILDRWSCNARFVASAGETERLLIQEPDFVPDIVLADFHLGRSETGLQVAEALRGRFHKDLPIVVITADHSPHVASAVQDNGCELLLKPVKPAELRALLQHLIG